MLENPMPRIRQNLLISVLKSSVVFAFAALSIFSSFYAIAASPKNAANPSPKAHNKQVKQVVKTASACHIPFRYDPILSPYIVIPARINGHAPMFFVVDTGAVGIPVVLDKWAAQELHLSVGAQSAELLNPHAPADVKTSRLQSIAFDDAGSGRGFHLAFSQISASAVVMDLSFFNLTPYSGPRIAGIIGADFFRGSSLLLQIDFQPKILTLYAGTVSLNFSNGDITIVSLQEQESDEFKGELFYLNVGLPNGQKKLFALDTGSPYTEIRDMAALQTPTAPTAKELFDWSGKQSVTTTLRDTVQMPTLQVGNFVEPDVTIGETGPNYPTRIGLDFLSRFSVLLDFVHKKMFLQRRADYNKCFFRPGYLGIHLKPQGGEMVVAAVSSSVPSGPTGIQDGDKVIAVDGQPLKSLSLTIAQQLLDGFAGQTASISLQHASGNKQVVRLIRGEVFKPYRNATLGLSFAWNQGHLLVWQIPEQSALSKELKFGDDVIELNGQKVADLTSHQALDLLNSQALSLQVWRDADKTWHELHLDGASTQSAPRAPQIIAGPPPAGYRWQYYPTAGWAAVPQ